MTADQLEKHAARLGVRLFEAIKPALMMAEAEAEQICSSPQELQFLRIKYFEAAFTLAAVAAATGGSNDGSQH